MKGTKEFLNHYKVVNDLQGIAEELKEAADTVKEAENELKKED